MTMPPRFPFEFSPADDLPNAEPDDLKTQHSASVAPELTGASGSAPDDLPRQEALRLAIQAGFRVTKYSKVSGGGFEMEDEFMKLIAAARASVVEAACSECGRKSTQDGMWALYCLDCVEKMPHPSNEQLDTAFTKVLPVLAAMPNSPEAARAERDAEVAAFKADATNLQRELDCLIPVLKESISWLRDLSTRWADHENWSYARACATRAEALLAKKPD